LLVLCLRRKRRYMTLVEILLLCRRRKRRRHMALVEFLGWRHQLRPQDVGIVMNANEQGPQLGLAFLLYQVPIIVIGLNDAVHMGFLLVGLFLCLLV
jgi:hypothetical protein